MKRLALSLVVGVSALAWAPAADAASPRADTYYVVMCTDTDGNLIQAESVDAHAIEQGGKAQAIALFSQHYPFGLTCWAEGPFTS